MVLAFRMTGSTSFSFTTKSNTNALT
jgi:hypothetical protein